MVSARDIFLTVLCVSAAGKLPSSNSPAEAVIYLTTTRQESERVSEFCLESDPCRCTYYTVCPEDVKCFNNHTQQPAVRLLQS